MILIWQKSEVIKELDIILYKTLENGIEIVEYEECHAAGLAEMWNKSKENWGGGNDLETAQSQLDFYRCGSYINVYLATDGAEVVGLCSLKRYYKDADALYIHNLNVCPEYMSKGIGKALLLHSLKRSIELGYPRLELNTWPGNTNAVPLYKKCGFMWEDNSETTHLTNFIPTIISQELLKPFFSEIDWYLNSSRAIETKPDGILSENFEYFTYKWQYRGQNLSVTIEKFGRRISCIETDDYKIEMTAENHDLAYGFEYKAAIKIENKTGKTLNIEIEDKDDGIVSYNHKKGRFYVRKPATKQDPMRAHPCILALVRVNGAQLEMGLGIDAKTPLKLRIDGLNGPAIPGSSVEAFISVESSLLSSAKCELGLPDNDLLHFKNTTHKFEIDKLGKASFPVFVEVLKAGYTSLDIQCSVKLSDGRDAVLPCRLEIMNFGITERFPCITESTYCIVNGPYRLQIGRDSNYAVIKHVLGYELALEFPISKLGKPYDDEFNIAEPTSVTTHDTDADIVIKMLFKSEKRHGITLGVVFSLSPCGVITRYHSVENTKNTPTSLFLSEMVFTGVNHNATYSYDGRITSSCDAGDEGFSSADILLFEENWVFENDPIFPFGVCWNPTQKPAFCWNDGVMLEHKLELAPLQIVETQPVIICIGIFKEYSAFRNYARRVYDNDIKPTEDLLEIIINSHNPFIIGDEFDLIIKNNRNKIYAGEATVKSRFFETQTQTNPIEERIPENSFKIQPDRTKICGGIGIIETHFSYPCLLSDKSTAVFFPEKSVELTITDGVFIVSSGLLTYKSDPRHFAGLFSLTDKNGTEWLMSKYPKLEPYSWWNPFIGGMYNGYEKMNNSNAVKESMAAEFVEIYDSKGNLWQGLKLCINITNNKEYKGMLCEAYHLTMPGMSVICSFSSYTNNIGIYLETEANECLFIQYDGENGERIAEITHKGKIQRFILGNNDFQTNSVEFAKISAESGMKLHWLANIRDRRALAFAANDNKSFEFARINRLQITNGAKQVTPPMFCVLSDRDLSRDELRVLERLTFLID